MTADSNSLRDFLQCMGLIRVAWKKIRPFFATLPPRHHIIVNIFQ